MLRARKLRWRRQAKQRKQMVEDLGSNAGDSFDKMFARRIFRLTNVRRFVAGWLVLMLLFITISVLQTRSLANYYLHDQPVAGGSFSEGVLGLLTNSNPLFVSGMVDSSVSRLVFSGLFSYDEQNNLTEDLAESWTLSDRGKEYIVKLRPGLQWHDSNPLTADDVVFTFKTAQNADAKSPLFHAWKDITITKLDDLTVKFTLKAAFAPFINSLTTGLLPSHILSDIEPTQLRSATFNTNSPVGSGPFMWNELEIIDTGDIETRQQNIGLIPYEGYHRGAPKIDSYIVKTFNNIEDLQEAFNERRVDAILGLDQLPEELEGSVLVHESTLSAIKMAFFESKDGLLADKSIRTALVLSADRNGILGDLGYPVISSNSPFLRNSFAYRPGTVQAVKDVEKARETLDRAKWALGQDGTRAKGERKLEITLIGSNSYENNIISRQLQQAWADIGIDTEVILQEDQDLQISIKNRSYDVLLNSISLGVDPDVYAYWHSTQEDPRSAALNFSNYESDVADAALEAGRSRIDIALRSAKYKPFLEEWVEDSPALALYQPRFIYVTRSELYNYRPKELNRSADRLNNVHNWMVIKDKVPLIEQ
jgi:peptide/nickel transport system substrate-binding protein